MIEWFDHEGPHLRGHPAEDAAPKVVEAHHYLEEVASGLRAEVRAVDVCTSVGHPGPAIAAAAREANVQLIAMATHGPGGLARLLKGSVATEVLQRATVPVLLVRPAAMPVRVAAPVEITSQPAEAVDLRPVTITLSPGDIELTREGLELLPYSSQREEHLSGRLRTLLERLEEAGRAEVVA